MKRIMAAIVMPSALFLAVSSWAAAYPERPIELIIPFGVGGGSDTAARTIFPALEKVLKTKTVITKLSGGGGTKETWPSFPLGAACSFPKPTR